MSLVSWNAGAWLGPACVLTPATAEDMSCAVKNLVKFATPFAMRGGGHMPIPDAANINSTGILISSTNLKVLELSEDGGTLSLGPGYRWGDAYIYLEETGTGKMIVGGRYAPVGVPGYLLGGGMSFFSYEYGFSSTNGNVDTFEVSNYQNLRNFRNLTNGSAFLPTARLPKPRQQESMQTCIGLCKEVETLFVW
jgi:FAD/FMN-containing dehydrogenase